jgi:aspartate/methionine/tyrosine aminotransferase
MEKARIALERHAGEKAYLPVAGILSLREAICKFHKEFDNLDNLVPENVIVGPGSKELLFLAENVFQGDVFLLYPTWITYSPQCLLAHHTPFVIRTKFEDDWRVTSEGLEKVLEESKSENKLLVLCHPDNPTGTSYSADHLKALTRVFRKHKVVVVSDEIYGRLHFTGAHESLAKYYPEGTIVSSGLSKWASAGGWRLGYHIYPASLKDLYNAVHSAASHTYSCASAPVQYAALSYLDLSEESRAYMIHTRRVMAAVAEYCYNQLILFGIKVVKPQGGFYMYPDFEIIRSALSQQGITSCQGMCDAMFKEASVVLMPWDTDCEGSERLTVRLCFVNFNGEKALKAATCSEDLSLHLSNSFVEEYCRETVEGITILCKWCNEQIKTETLL